MTRPALLIVLLLHKTLKYSSEGTISAKKNESGFAALHSVYIGVVRIQLQGAQQPGNDRQIKELQVH